MKECLRNSLAWVTYGTMGLCSRSYRPDLRPALVIAPHADDETLGCGALIVLRSSLGLRTVVLFLTDSAGPGADATQAARRREEAGAALTELGLSGDAIRHLGLPDGRLNRLSEAEQRRMRETFGALLAELQPGEIFLPSSRDGSSEHDAVRPLLESALALGTAPIRLWEYPVWAWWDARRLWPQALRLTGNACIALPGQHDRKARALARHVSQLAPAGPDVLPKVLRTFGTANREFHFAADLRRPRDRAHPWRRILRRLLLRHLGYGHPVPAEILDREYTTGHWDHFASAQEQPRYDAIHEMIARHLPARPRILELGCGDGHLALLLQALPPTRYVGIDLSPTAIARARARTLPDTEFILADFERWRPESAYDLIILNESTGYANDPRALLASYHAALTPGGRILISQYRAGNSAALWRRLLRAHRIEAQDRVASSDGRLVWDLRLLQPLRGTSG